MFNSSLPLCKTEKESEKGGRSCSVQKHHMTGYPAAHAKLIITFSKQAREWRQKELVQKRVEARAYESLHSHFHTLMIYCHGQDLHLSLVCRSGQRFDILSKGTQK